MLFFPNALSLVNPGNHDVLLCPFNLVPLILLSISFSSGVSAPFNPPSSYSKNPNVLETRCKIRYQICSSSFTPTHVAPCNETLLFRHVQG